MIFKDYYKILALETNKASIEDIKISYREQAKKYHPDLNGQNANAEERFKDINEAYKILSDQTTRKKYDRMWNSHIGKKKAKIQSSQKEKVSTATEVFNIFFGGQDKEDNRENSNLINKKIPIQGENIETEIDISIEDAFYGREKKISLRAVNGRMKTFNIKIPEGIRNGEKIRLMGQGKPGQNGAKSGDLLIKVQIVNDTQYKLIGTDIYRDVYITPWEAVLGAKVEANTIDESFLVYVPKGMQTGECITIPQKGYKDGKGGRGNLVLQTKIMIQRNITEEEKKLYKELKEISKFNPRQTYM